MNHSRPSNSRQRRSERASAGTRMRAAPISASECLTGPTEIVGLRGPTHSPASILVIGSRLIARWRSHRAA